MLRHSGLQKEVLKLYKSFLRELQKKPHFEGKAQLQQHIRDTFKLRASTVSVRDIKRVEHFLRYGRRQLEILKLQGTEGTFDHFSIGFGKSLKMSIFFGQAPQFFNQIVNLVQIPERIKRKNEIESE